MVFPGTLLLILGEPAPIDVNCTDGIRWIWVVFRQCAVSPQEIVAVTFGLLSTTIWVVFAVPQIVENCRKGIPDQAVSPFLLLCFLVGDTVNLAGCIFVHQLPLQVSHDSTFYGFTSSLVVGYVLGWISASIYISSRIPQILKNWRRGSTDGLSPITFIFAIVGNVAYALQTFLTSVELTFIIRALPWLFGSLGVVLFDLIFCRYHGRGYISLEEDVEVTTC
ncbi:unnamed protein product [Hydatigera taeniaeformis]|uniref:PQ loop repeat protein n=1 Tax=Hydatigena taeniaeformis TaxID=6205 RepID=A0A0R3X7D1_HYDTA|nr:unnamed protein product [Hydatigera taeniaeformis]